MVLYANLNLKLFRISFFLNFEEIKDLRIRIRRLTLFVIVLLISFLAILGSVTQLPVLYSLNSYARLLIPTAICFVFIGLANFLDSWRNL